MSLLLALAVGEGVFRWHLSRGRSQPHDDSEWRMRYRRMNETLYRRSEVQGLVYEPRPGSSIEMEYGLASFNSAGMRDDREFERERGDRIRIALLGDSLVWSEFMSLEQSLPRRVEQALGGETHEVLNFGVTGYDTTQEALWYERAVSPFAPSIVVVVYCMNDMMIMSGPYNRFADDRERGLKEEQDRMFDLRAPVRRETLDRVARQEEDEAWLKTFARARAFWRRATFARNYVDEYTVCAADGARVTRRRAALGKLGESIANDGARGVLVISPVLESWRDYHWSDIHEAVAADAREAGFTVIDPLEMWRQERDPKQLRFPGDNLHYNPRGNILLAETIASAIGEMGGQR